MLAEGLDEVRVSGISDAECADTVQLSAGGAESDVVTLVVLDEGLGQEGVVLELGLAVRPKKKHRRKKPNEERSFRSTQNRVGGAPTRNQMDSLYNSLLHQVGKEGPIT